MKSDTSFVHTGSKSAFGVGGDANLLGHALLDLRVLVQDLDSHLPPNTRPLELVVIETGHQVEVEPKVVGVEFYEQLDPVALRRVEPWTKQNGALLTRCQDAIEVWDLPHVMGTLGL